MRNVQPHQITMGRDSRRAIATNAEGHELRIEDNVKEIDGEVCTFVSVLFPCSSLRVILGSKRSSIAHPPVTFCLSI